MIKVLSLLLLMSTPVLAVDMKSLNKQIDATNVLVNDGCSGTFVGDNLVLTAAHCIIDQYKTVEKEVIKDDGTVKKEKFQVTVPGTVSQNIYVNHGISQTIKYIYKIEKSSRSLDLALLRTKGRTGSVARIACDEVLRGDTIYAVGNSFAVLYATLTKGNVSSVNRSYRDLGLIGDLGDPTDDGEHGLVQHSAPIAGGNSGGALYNEASELVGVNVRGVRTGGFAFSVPLNDITGFVGDSVKKECN